MFRPFRTFRDYLRISGVGPISRRYFVMNSFDGAMTMLGIIVGSYATGILDAKVIVGAGTGASLAMAVSGFAGAYMTERAETTRRLRKLKRAMLSDLDSSIHEKAVRIASLWVALIDALSPAMAAILSMAPFLIVLFGLLAVELAARLSIFITMTMLFLLGLLLGRISKENMFLFGLKMVAAGTVAVVLTMLLRGL